MYDKLMWMATAPRRGSANWKTAQMAWSAFVQKLATPVRDTEPVVQYLKLKKAQQDELKDKGGYVFGALKDTRRKATSLVNREAITLDLDSIAPNGTGMILGALDTWGCAAVVHSTRKHQPEKPRLRVIIPLSDPIEPDQYEPMARWFGAKLGIDNCDVGTFQPSRLMYWPSTCSDSEYVYKYYDKAFASSTGVLSQIKGILDAPQYWPRASSETKQHEKRIASEKAEDPGQKKGVVGAFCRTYGIRDAMEQFIPDVYDPVEGDDARFTFAAGSTQGGVLVYDDKWLYSYHATDPCAGRLINAYDMVRLHRYGVLDEDQKESTPVNRLKSSKAMSEFALKLGKVKQAVIAENIQGDKQADQQLADDFADLGNADLAWRGDLTLDTKGGIACTAPNVCAILENDKSVAGCIGFDVFMERPAVVRELPWGIGIEHPKPVPRNWDDEDEILLQYWLSDKYKLQAPDRIVQQALAHVFTAHRFDKPREYFDSLEGTPYDVDELERWAIDYLGVEDTPYARAVTRKFWTAIVARQYEPGRKFDYVPVFIGDQGKGKSTACRVIGFGSAKNDKDVGWYLGQLAGDLASRDTFAKLRGKLLVEIGEIDRFNKKESAEIKDFLTQQEDEYRVAYARHEKAHKRRCIFIGTTNVRDFLTDATGNRRYWVLNCRPECVTKSIWDDMPGRLPSLWAAAVALYKAGEPLYLDPELEASARVVQASHTQEDEWQEVIRAYLDAPLPPNWYSQLLPTRVAQFSGRQPTGGENAIRRDVVCVREIWLECLHESDVKIDYRTSRRITACLRKLGWIASHDAIPGYGYPKTFKRFPSSRVTSQQLAQPVVDQDTGRLLSMFDYFK